MTQQRSGHPPRQPLTPPSHVIDDALRKAGRALLHPVSSAEFNLALRKSNDADELRKALGELLSKAPWNRWVPIADALILALQAGEAAGGRRGRRGVRQQRCQRAALSHLVYVLNGLTTMLHANSAQIEWWREWPAGCEFLPDDQEQALFERWKRERLRRRIWPSLPAEERVLLIRPVLEMVFMFGAYRALQRHSERWPLWRFCKGAACRRHDALDGLCAPNDAPVWKAALPPLAYFCDCRIEPQDTGARS